MLSSSAEATVPTHCNTSTNLAQQKSWGRAAVCLYWLAQVAIIVCSHILSMYMERIYSAKKMHFWPFVPLLYSDGDVELPWSILNSSSGDILFAHNIKKKKKALLWKVQQKQQHTTCISARCGVQVVKSSSQTDGDSELKIQLWKSCDFQWESCA